MVTTAEAPAASQTHGDLVVGIVRSAIAGHPQGAIRRIVLYLVVGIALGGLAGGTVLTIVLGVIGLGALLLLAVTDQVA